MPRRRPRISLLTAFLLTAAFALSIVVVRQHRELETLRKDLHNTHSFWKHRLKVDDESKLHASAMVDIETFLWGWNVWVPPDAKAVLRFKWGDIPAVGYPNDAVSIEIPTGENWLALLLNEHPVSGESLGQLYHPNSVYGFVVPRAERLSRWWKPEYRTDVVGIHIVRETEDGRLQLQRFRVAGDDAPADFAAPGFIIWLERR